jgi:hypothetical protein
VALCSLPLIGTKDSKRVKQEQAKDSSIFFRVLTVGSKTSATDGFSVKMAPIAQAAIKSIKGNPLSNEKIKMSRNG